MPRLLFEYKDQPIIIKHDFEKVLDTQYISIFKSRYGKIEQNTHNNLDELIEQKSKYESLILKFISIEGIYDNGDKEILNYEVFFNQENEIVFSEKNKLEFDNWKITYTNESIYLDFQKELNRNFKRVLSLDRIVDYNYDETYYEIIPVVHNLLSELYFINDIIINKINEDNYEKLEAYLMQAKIKYENL